MHHRNMSWKFKGDKIQSHTREVKLNRWIQCEIEKPVVIVALATNFAQELMGTKLRHGWNLQAIPKIQLFF
ncbi:hypothetical protein XELAEV_18018329mg [Xenopus laevis]|uniref:Uncharacterized protein n=1 Tax=Xenopus laevis TaxID=8355 RepID=A0A974DE23_XENLA|nr:hypothetical protein XELAEV_18018329mg [Xenopus laevis]